MTPAVPERFWARLLVLSCVWLLTGCVTTGAIPVGPFRTLDPPLKTLALAPNGGVFADLIGTALAAEGYLIVDTGATLALLVLMQSHQDDLLSSDVLAKLKARGIDAVLVVQKDDGKDGIPQTVHIRLYSTAHMGDVGGVYWRNGWIRRGMLESAREIAAALSKNSPPSEAVGNDEQGSLSSHSGGQ